MGRCHFGRAVGCRKGLHHCAEHQGYLESAGPNIRVIRHRPGRSLSTKLSLSWAARTAQCEGCSFACCMDSSPAFTEHQGHPGWGWWIASGNSNRGWQSGPSPSPSRQRRHRRTRCVAFFLTRRMHDSNNLDFSITDDEVWKTGMVTSPHVFRSQTVGIWNPARMPTTSSPRPAVTAPSVRCTLPAS